MANGAFFNITPKNIKEIWSRLRVVPQNGLEAAKWVARLKEATPDAAEALMAEFDERFVGNGVAYLPNPNGDSPTLKQGVSYINLGEAYTPTICYFHKQNCFIYASWGDALDMMENSHE